MSIGRGILYKLINKKNILLFITLSFLLFISSAYQNKALSLNFVDEEYNFTLGKYLLEGGVIYKGQFSNHQPLPFILSGAIQKISNPNSIFLLVKRHREVIIIYSLLCSILLVWRFGLPLLLFVLIYEQTKFFLLGNLFLSESLVVYPLVYLVSLIFFASDIKKLELFTAGLSLGFIIFLLAPLWPLAFFIFLIFSYRSHFNFKKMLIIILGIAPFMIISFLFTSLTGYLNDAIFINLRYFIPFNSTDPLFISIFKSFSAPFISLLSYQDTPTLRLIKLSSVILFASLFLMYKKKGIAFIFISLSILTLSNLRFIEPGSEYYRGFHLLPWYALLILLGVLTGSLVYKFYKSYFIRTPIILMILLTVGIGTLEASKYLYIKADIARDLYIHYSPQFSMGEAIRIMKNSGDSLFVAPDEWLIYWQSGLWPPRKINSYYDWMEKVPILKEQIDQTFKEDPPEFFYCNCSENSYLNRYTTMYKVLEKDNKPTQLYVLPSKLESLNKIQIENLKFYGFEIE